MVAIVQTSTVLGVEAVTVTVEVRVRSGSHRFQIIGLGDNAIKESRDRVWSALANSGFTVPDQVLVNLAPAELKKEGAAFDLPIAVGILLASRQIPSSSVAGKILIGELSLSGEVKPVRGIAAAVASAKSGGFEHVIVPMYNHAEAALIEGLIVVGVKSLSQAVGYLRDGDIPIPEARLEQSLSEPQRRYFSDVAGQDAAKRAMIIAAAGGHNLLMIGPPGCGKSMLAERFPALLPPLTPAERLECVKIHSVGGMALDSVLAGHRPFRCPHYVISEAGLVGGGNPPKPGEITLAHRGVLFLDEFPEFKRGALEALRIPLERGLIPIARARHSVIFPARFQLIAAMNPCPCGKLGSSGAQTKGRCACSRSHVEWYLRKLSEPILDRIDLHIEMNAVSIAQITAPAAKTVDEEGQHKIVSAVSRAHLRQRNRNGGILNAFVAHERLRQLAVLSPQALSLLERAAEKLELSARGFIRMVRLGRTIADLDEADAISPAHIAEAVSFRGLERLRSYARSAM